jgi:hypothetical protein
MKIELRNRTAAGRFRGNVYPDRSGHRAQHVRMLELEAGGFE